MTSPHKRVTLQGFVGDFPTDQVQILKSAVGSLPAPKEGLGLFGTGMKHGGWHFFPVPTTVEGYYPTTELEVKLFRHDVETAGDFAKLELEDTILRAYVTAKVVLRIKGEDGTVVKNNPLKPDFEAIHLAHFASPDNDPWEATEDVLNPHLKRVLQSLVYSTYEGVKEELRVDNQDDQSDDSVDEQDILTKRKAADTVKNISPKELLRQLGFHKSGGYVYPQGEHKDVGTDIIESLQRYGVYLVDVFLDDIALPESVEATLEDRARQLQQLQTDIQVAVRRAQLIQLQNENLQSETVGFAQAIAAAVEGSELTTAQMFAKLEQYPALERALGEQAKVIFTGGQSAGSIVNQVLGALEANQ